MTSDDTCQLGRVSALSGMDERRAAAFEAALLPWSSDIEPDGREGCSAAIPFEQGKSKTRAKNLARRPIRIRLLSAPDYHSFRVSVYSVPTLSDNLPSGLLPLVFYFLNDLVRLLEE